MKTKFKAKIIESLNGGVAVEFSNGRIEFVAQNNEPVGTGGWAIYSPLPLNQGYVWKFTAFKKRGAK